MAQEQPPAALAGRIDYRPILAALAADSRYAYLGGLTAPAAAFTADSADDDVVQRVLRAREYYVSLALQIDSIDATIVSGAGQQTRAVAAGPSSNEECCRRPRP